MAGALAAMTACEGQVTNDVTRAGIGGTGTARVVTGGVPIAGRGASLGTGGATGGRAVTGGRGGTGGTISGGTAVGGNSSGGVAPTGGTSPTAGTGGSAQGGSAGAPDCASRTEAACQDDCLPIYGKPAGCLLRDLVYAGCIPSHGICIDSPGCAYPTGHPEQCLYFSCFHVADGWYFDFTCDAPECVYCHANPRPGGSDWLSDDCPDTAPATMAALPEGYSIDSTEVTRGQYQTWLKTHPSTQDQIPDCSWNTSFAPDFSCMSRQQVSHDSGYCEHPQVCLDWCDAYAYCQAIGQRLCGKIGGGAIQFEDYANGSLSQWYNACTSHGAYPYPYGSSYDAEACNGYEYSGVAHVTRAAGTLSSCQSDIPGYAGVYDLSGNVWEWQDSCQSVAGVSYCRLGGGSFYGSASNLTCDIDSYEYRQVTSQIIGFRCCSSP